LSQGRDKMAEVTSIMGNAERVGDLMRTSIAIDQTGTPEQEWRPVVGSSTAFKPRNTRAVAYSWASTAKRCIIWRRPKCLTRVIICPKAI